MVNSINDYNGNIILLFNVVTFTSNFPKTIHNYEDGVEVYIHFHFATQGFAACGKVLGRMAEFVDYLHMRLSQNDKYAKLAERFW